MTNFILGLAVGLVAGPALLVIGGKLALSLIHDPRNFSAGIALAMSSAFNNEDDQEHFDLEQPDMSISDVEVRDDSSVVRMSPSLVSPLIDEIDEDEARSVFVYL